MKSSKKIFFTLSFLVIILTFISFLTLKHKPDTFNPISNKNNFYDQLNLALKTSHLETSSWQVRDFINQIEFTVADENNTFKVLLSDQKNPLNQIVSLQQIIKTAKMKKQTLKLVDLSAVHPYATFKNN